MYGPVRRALRATRGRRPGRRPAVRVAPPKLPSRNFHGDRSCRLYGATRLTPGGEGEVSQHERKQHDHLLLDDRITGGIRFSVQIDGEREGQQQGKESADRHWDHIPNPEEAGEFTLDGTVPSAHQECERADYGREPDLLY